jgi:hypothetical protein
VVGGLVVGLLVGAGVDHSIMSGRIDRMTADQAEADRKRAVRKAADLVAARFVEQEMVESFGRRIKDKENEKNIIAGKLDAAVASLRNRPERAARPSTPTTSAPDCKGSTGAELSRPDAEFLTREAARADGVRADLAACYAQYDDAREALERYRKQISQPATPAP